MMHLKLAREIYQDQIDDKFQISTKITSPFKFFLIFNHWIYVSHDNNILIEREISLKNLYNKENTNKIIVSMITKFLRFFGFTLSDVEKVLPKFREILDQYLEPVFKFTS